MDGCFCLKFAVSEQEPLYLDIPGSRCEDGVQVEGYFQLHGGDNQQWIYSDNKIVSLIDYPSYILAVTEVKAGSPVELYCKDNTAQSCYKEWVFENNGTIKLKQNKDFCLSVSNNGCVVLQQLGNSNNSKWEKVNIDCRPKPASSCHLTYEPPSISVEESWTLENTVCVRESASSTYFCVVGWGPGGYSGIQQDADDKRFAIFSMWNDGENKVALHEVGDGVEASTFGGEGTGMKSMKVLDWKNNEKISFRISGAKKHCEEESKIFWECSCWYMTVQSGDWVFMASYRRPGNDSPFKQHFYSFIENWDRSAQSEGCKMLRYAEFSQAKLNGQIDNNNNEHVFDKAIFTKVQDGCDRFAADRCFGGVKSSLAFMLSTGGKSEDGVNKFLEKQYEQCTSVYLTELFL